MAIKGRKEESATERSLSKKSAVSKSTSPDNSEPKFSHPQIMLIDLPRQASISLKEKGYDVRYASFGQPFAVQRSASLYPLTLDPFIGHEECEIVVADLLGLPPVAPDSIEHIKLGYGANHIWARADSGIIDPRPVTMSNIDSSIERLLEHKGILILFASPENFSNYTFGTNTYSGIQSREELVLSNWQFKSLNHFSTTETHGESINLSVNANSAIGKLLTTHLNDSSYSCTINFEQDDNVTVFAENKFSKAVSLGIVMDTGGCILIFPRIARQAEFITSLITDVLPEIVPHLYPDSTKHNWVHSPPYEQHLESKLKSDIVEIRRQAEIAIAEKETAIKDSVAKNQFLYDLLTQTGDELVEAVKHALSTLGFTEVIDVDEEMREGRLDEIMKREDLWIKGHSPVLLAEVKGVNGFPSEAEAMQAHKYVAPRMRTWKRTDVQGIGIFNHQRHLPPLDREHKTTFTPDTLTNAKEYEFGLLTTWDLHRLTRNYLKHGWKHQNIRDLFYLVGRIEPIPTHYEYLGTIDEFWPKAKAFSIKLTDSPVMLKINDKIAFEMPVEFEEQEVASLHLDNKPVLEASSGQVPSTKTHLGKESLRPGLRVFKVKSN